MFQPDFLDEVALDTPMGCWSIQPDTTNEVAIIRNNLWAGFTAFHQCGTGRFGGVYVGDAVKNIEICFQM